MKHGLEGILLAARGAERVCFVLIGLALTFGLLWITVPMWPNHRAGEVADDAPVLSFLHRLPQQYRAHLMERGTWSRPSERATRE
jgi:hypothetical protein